LTEEAFRIIFALWLLIFLAVSIFSARLLMADDLGDVEELDGDIEGTEDPSAEREKTESLSDKQQAQLTLEVRRRLELKLEEVRVKKQMQEYEFDDDFE
jgi:hypothetical protein